MNEKIIRDIDDTVIEETNPSKPEINTLEDLVDIVLKELGNRELDAQVNMQFLIQGQDELARITKLMDESINRQNTFELNMNNRIDVIESSIANTLSKAVIALGEYVNTTLVPTDVVEKAENTITDS